MRKEHFIRGNKIKWMPEYNKTKKILPILKKQSLDSNLLIRCNSILINFNNNMTAADRIISSRKPNIAMAKSIFLKLKQVKIELERLASDISKGKRKTNIVRLNRRRMETMKTPFDEQIEEAKAKYEEDKEQFKLALNILSEHAERQTQVVQKITS